MELQCAAKALRKVSGGDQGHHEEDKDVAWHLRDTGEVAYAAAARLLRGSNTCTNFAAHARVPRCRLPSRFQDPQSHQPQEAKEGKDIKIYSPAEHLVAVH
ncbi:hypothetical protein Cni_G07486 [Canna indica]|uniref:Uncharacterized protein n=1 Tax=Canna indica TaxID=4628 RepID=A0AAQ3K0F8_9LILI|nr:hypothetical protein Cni_G07486 [Canna indica]